MSNPCCVVMMARVPDYGHGKTRLAQGIGEARAVWFQRHMIARLTRRLWQPKRWQFCLSLAWRVPHQLPRHYARHWAPVRCMTQPSGDLGARISDIWRQLSPAFIIVIGSDMPDISVQDILRTRQCLQRADAVVGPSYDGGFWLLGLRPEPKRAIADLFAQLPWSHSQTRYQLMQRLRPRRIVLLDERRDIDTAEDYHH